MQTIEELARQYARHPEEKAADAAGQPATEETVGLLYRLHIVGRVPTHLGKEIDRLSEEGDMTIDDQEPIRYEQNDSDSVLDAALEVLQQLSQAEVAAEIGISERRLRDIEHHRVKPRKRKRDAIVWFAYEVRSGRRGGDARSSSKPAKSYSGLDANEGGFPWGGAIVGGFFLLALFGAILSGRNPQTFSLAYAPERRIV